MLLTQTVEGLVSHLNTTESLAAWRPAGNSTLARAEFDPLLNELTELSVFVSPGQNVYSIESSPKRGQLRGHVVFPTVLLTVGKPFDEIPDEITVGVANWSEAREVMDTLERLEEIAMYYKPEGLSLNAIEQIPPDEINTDVRNFGVVTQIVYERLGCSSEHALT